MESLVPKKHYLFNNFDEVFSVQFGGFSFETQIQLSVLYLYTISMGQNGESRTFVDSERRIERQPDYSV